MSDNEYDVVITGGGLVGASLAIALADGGLSVAVVEAVTVNDDGDGNRNGDGNGNDGDVDEHVNEHINSHVNKQPSFDARTIALTYIAREIYERIGVWNEIAARHAQPIREIHISERGRFGMTHLHHRDVGREALGYVVPSRVLGAVLHRRLAQCDGVTVLCPATVANVDDGAVTIKVNDASRTLRAQVVVIADGGRSGLAAQSGVTAREKNYPQRAILCVVATDRDHDARAYERFTAEGPLALLPHSARKFAVVWTTDAAQVDARMALPDDAFIGELQRAFGDRAGNFTAPTPRKSYPLQRREMARPTAPRMVVIGNAAHTVHPVAGQGFNLGLRDVAVLAEVLRDAYRRGRDLGDAEILARYADRRRRDTRMVSGFTDGLIRVFGSRRKSVTFARNLALVGIELCPPMKRMLLRRTMGMTANLTVGNHDNRRGV